MKRGWFGESWDAPVCEPERHQPTPVGENCDECGEPIRSQDQGMIIPFIGELTEVTKMAVYHLKCFLAAIIGPDLADEIWEICND